MGKVFEKFFILKEKYNVLSLEYVHLKNENSYQLTPGFDPGHVLVSEEQEPHIHNHLK